jgi:hypothetical protein
MKRLKQINTRHMDHGVGVLRGVLAKIEFRHSEDVEAAIEHIRAAARLIEKLQRQVR